MQPVEISRILFNQFITSLTFKGDPALHTSPGRCFRAKTSTNGMKSDEIGAKCPAARPRSEEIHGRSGGATKTAAQKRSVGCGKWNLFNLFLDMATKSVLTTSLGLGHLTPSTSHYTKNIDMFCKISRHAFEAFAWSSQEDSCCFGASRPQVVSIWILHLPFLSMYCIGKAKPERRKQVWTEQTARGPKTWLGKARANRDW